MDKETLRIHLHEFAKSNGTDEIIDELEKGTSVDIVSDMGETALFWAARGGHVEAIKLLIDKGADIDAQDAAGNTPVMIAVTQAKPDICKFLLDNGASASIENKAGDTVVSIAMRLADKCKCLAIVMAAVGSNMDGGTLLLNAAQNGNIERLRAVLRLEPYQKEKGQEKEKEKKEGDDIQATDVPDINFTDKNGRTALMVAASSAHYDCVKLLLENGASINQKDKDGLTALIWAIRKSNSKVAELLATYVPPNSSGSGDDQARVDEFESATRFLGQLATKLLSVLDPQSNNNNNNTIQPNSYNSCLL